MQYVRREGVSNNQMVKTRFRVFLDVATICRFSGGEAEPYESGRTAKDLIDFVNSKVRIVLSCRGVRDCVQVGDEPENLEGIDLSTFSIKQLKKLILDRGEKCAGCSEVLLSLLERRCIYATHITETRFR